MMAFRHRSAILPGFLALLCFGRFCLAQESSSSDKRGFEIQAAERVQLSHKNLFGQDIQFTGSGALDSRQKKARAGLALDPIGDTPFFAGFDLWAGQEGDERYRLQSQGRDVFAGAHLTKEMKATLKLENQDVTLYHLSDDAPQVFRDSALINKTGDLALLLERSKLNDRFYPTRGTQQSLEYAFARDGFLSECSFNRVAFQFRGYVTPGEFFTFAFRTRAGWIEGYGSTDEIPYFERFFNGGTGLVRGYRSRQVGPKDSQDLPLGGELLWVNNFEIRFPLYKKLSGAYFVDAGGVWPDARAFRLDELKCGTGPGLRLPTKWGVARLDLGIRLTRDKGEPRAVLHASFGVPF